MWGRINDSQSLYCVGLLSSGSWQSIGTFRRPVSNEPYAVNLALRIYLIFTSKNYRYSTQVLRTQLCSCHWHIASVVNDGYVHTCHTLQQTNFSDRHGRPIDLSGNRSNHLECSPPTTGYPPYLHLLMTYVFAQPPA